MTSARDQFGSSHVSDEVLDQVRDRTVRARVRRRSRAGQAVGAVDAAGILAALPEELGRISVGPAGMGEAELINIIESANRLQAWAAAVQCTAIAAWAGDQALVNPHDTGFRDWEEISMFSAKEIALACSVSTRSASNLMGTALSLVDRLTATLAALRRGDIDVAKAQIMADATCVLSPENAARVERIVLDELVGPGLACSYRQWGMRINELLIEIDPETAEKRRKNARQDRRVALSPVEDGMADLWARLEAADAVAVYAQLTRLATAPHPGDERTTDQRRADALVESIIGPAPESGSAAAATQAAMAGVPVPEPPEAVEAGADGPADETGNGNRADGAAADETRAAAADETEAIGAEHETEPTGAEDDPARVLGHSATDAATDLGPGAAGDESRRKPGGETDEAPPSAPGRRAERDGPAQHELAAIGAAALGLDGSGEPLGRPPNSSWRLPSEAARTPLIAVTVAASTLMGLDDLPAQLEGYGRITAEAARELAADGTWRRLLTDPESGHLLDYGDTTYRPPKVLMRHVRARDRSCRFPTCNRPADVCDLDHAVPFPRGRTSARNLHALCRRDHRLKGEAGWYVERLDDNSVLWVTPTGHARLCPLSPVLRPEPVEEAAPSPDDDPPPF